ncbi:MAG: trimethylamine methyltransferase family protein [Spirochaetes bacterium]|nr:trimethylamine methyltransferase family protein [Spirochaetota bacterium]
MKSSSYQVLSADEIGMIHGRTLEVLSGVGIKVVVKKMRDLLTDAGCHVDENTKIVRFPPEMAERYIRMAPREFTLGGADPSVQRTVSPDTRIFSGLGTAINLFDLESGAYRQTTLNDVRDHIILIDNCQHINSNQMDIWPHDVPMHTIHVEAIRTWLMNCRKSFGMGAYGVLATTDMMEMVKIAFGIETIRERHPYVAIISIQSPLSTAHIQLEGLMILAENGQPAIMSPEAMAGTTAPVTLAGLLVQHNAEVLSHIIMAQVVRPGAPVMYGSVSTVAEMRRGTVALGAIETGMISAASAQMAAHYDIPCRTVAGGTESKTLDVQCGLERMHSIMLAAMGGANYITCAGTIESTTAGAHELLMIDDEIAGMVERAIRGIEVNDTTMAATVIGAVGPDGNYLMEEHTQRHFRGEHFIPRLADRDKRDVWEKAGSRDMAAHARERAKKILADHRERQLDEATVREIDRFVESVRSRSVSDYYSAEWES